MTPRSAFSAAILFLCSSMAFSVFAQNLSTLDTVVAIARHGEKPHAGLGMLNCQGLNRALALGPRLAAIAGRPDKIIAPNPSARKVDSGVAYDYNRPLLTIGPTAIASGLPIDTSVAWNDHEGLARALDAPELAGKIVYVAWEHHLALQAVRDLFTLHGSDTSTLPTKWRDDDFDTVLLVHVPHAPGSSITVTIEHENLDGKLSAQCPG